MSDDELLQLEKNALIAALERARAAESIVALREGISTLREQIDSGVLEGDHESDVVTFGRDYLLAELDQIAATQTLERAKYYVERLIKSVTAPRTSLINDIDLSRWKEYNEIQTDSLWMIERRDNSGVHSADYWGNFVPQIPRQLMLRYTKRGDWVLDTFAGSGTTMIEGQRLGRNTLGIELQESVAERARTLIAAERKGSSVVSDVVVGDSTNEDYAALLARYGRTSVQLVVMHPPYHDIITFSDDARDLSNAPTVERFLEQMGAIAERAAAVLDRGRYLALVIGDKYAGGEWIPLGFRTMEAIMQRGFSLKSVVVKNFDTTTGKRQQKELWRYRALAGGFYVFKHEYMFVLRKK